MVHLCDLLKTPAVRRVLQARQHKCGGELPIDAGRLDTFSVLAWSSTTSPNLMFKKNSKLLTYRLVTNDDEVHRWPAVIQFLEKKIRVKYD